MNNYQIYDEIGKGRHSIVYKGRKKKSIEYFAIASIEKSQRQRVLTSVQFLRSVSHRNIIKFHNWYETNNHLWVITEYCIGGNLRAVMDLDQKLPESSVRILGLDLVEGLVHLHSKGIIYGDLKPSNLLMDATASLRFYDFGLACSFEAAGHASRVGTPSYMAPELFRDGGVPSMASDLWSLGCVLYEMVTGAPPFTASTIQALIQKIVNEPFPRLEGVSSAFVELVEGLLQKDPLERATWADVIHSDLWQGKLVTTASPLPAFPPQPAFEAFKKQQMEFRRPLSKEVERRNKDILRASINAERNLARELAQHGGGQYATLLQKAETGPAPGSSVAQVVTAGGSSASATPSAAPTAAVLTIDREVDFSDPTADGNAASGGSDGAAQDVATPLAVAAATEAAVMLEPVLNAKRKSNDGASGVPLTTAAGTEDAIPSSSTLPRIEELLVQASDAHIRPLVTNARIEKPSEPKYDPAYLGFAPMGLAALKQVPSRDLEAFLNTVFKALSAPTTHGQDMSDKVHVLNYFETLCGDATIANVVINSSVMALCVKLLSQSSTTRGGHGNAVFRAAVASVMGLLVRHATFIHSDLAKTNLVQVLAEALDEELSLGNMKGARKLLACLGELLFYIGTQTDEERVCWPLNQPAVCSSLRSLYLKSMQHDDDVLKHYAVKAMENLLSIADSNVGRLLFACQPAVEALLHIYALPLAPPARNEHLKSSAVCAAMKLCFTDNTLFASVLFSPVFHVQSYGDVLSTSNAKTVQILGSFINTLLWRAVCSLSCARDAQAIFGVPTTATDTALPLEVARSAISLLLAGGNVATGLCAVLEHSNAAVRNKGLIAMSLLTVVPSGLALDDSVSTRLFPAVDKAIKDKDASVQRVVPMLAHAASGYMARVVAGLSSALTAARSPTSITAPVAASEVISVLGIVTSPSLRCLLSVSEATLTQLASCVTAFSQLEAHHSSSAIAGGSPATTEETIHSIIESIAADAALRGQHYLTIASSVVQPYGALLRHQEGSQRFRGVQMVLNLLTPIVQDTHLYDPAASTCAVVPHISDFIRSIAPVVPQLLQDGEPIPLYVLKLLSLCSERSPTVTMSFLQGHTRSMLDTLLVFLDPTHPSSSVYVVRLLLRMLQCGGDEIVTYTAERGIVPKLLASMVHSESEGSWDVFAEPCFELTFFLLCAAVNDPASAVAQQASHLIMGRHLETLFFPACATKFGPSSECAASSIFLLTQLFSEARQTMLQPATLSTLRDIFSDLDAPAVHTALPLVRALLLCVSVCASSRDALKHVLQNEPLLVVLQDLAERTSLSQDLAAQASELLQTLYKL